MQVTITRRGGIAGIASRGTVDTSAVPGSEEALRSLKAAAEPPRPDAFTYDFRFENQTLTVNEPDMNDALRTLADDAVARGELL